MSYDHRTDPRAPRPGLPRRRLLALTGAAAALSLSPTRSEAVAIGFRSLAFGDSLIEGGSSGSATGGMSYVWCRELGWPPPINKGSGGTGYQNPGTIAGRMPYPDRIGPVLDAHPGLDVVVIEGGCNDSNNDLTGFRAAVKKTFAIARQKQPLARIYVLGPYAPKGAGNTLKTPIIRDEARLVGFPFIDQTEWMMGWPGRLASDGFHPNAAGHLMLGHRAATELALAGAPR